MLGNAAGRLVRGQGHDLNYLLADGRVARRVTTRTWVTA
jgi:hypothetical protein